MITFFTTGKAFRGHDGIIQRNALRSWKLLHPDVEVILFGDDEGAAEVCAELGLRHEPKVERHESGMKYLNYMFERAQEAARHDYLCYSNCDIVLTGDFRAAFERVREWRERFLLVAQRWDTDVREPIGFEDRSWAKNLRELAKAKGFHQDPNFIDFFVFRRGMYADVPPLVVGRSYWDHWLVWKASSSGAAVVDASAFVTAIHQNHSYGYHPEGKKGTNEDALALRNRELSGNGRHLRSMLDAKFTMSRYGRIRWSPLHRPLGELLGKHAVQVFLQNVVTLTFWPRRVLGLRRAALDRWFGSDIDHLGEKR